jgi:hypothetical protein
VQENHAPSMFAAGRRGMPECTYVRAGGSGGPNLAESSPDYEDHLAYTQVRSDDELARRSCMMLIV